MTLQPTHLYNCPTVCTWPQQQSSLSTLILQLYNVHFKCKSYYTTDYNTNKKAHCTYSSLPEQKHLCCSNGCALSTLQLDSDVFSVSAFLLNAAPALAGEVIFLSNIFILLSSQMQHIMRRYSTATCTPPPPLPVSSGWHALCISMATAAHSALTGVSLSLRITMATPAPLNRPSLTRNHRVCVSMATFRWQSCRGVSRFKVCGVMWRATFRSKVSLVVWGSQQTVSRVNREFSLTASTCTVCLLSVNLPLITELWIKI